MRWVSYPPRPRGRNRQFLFRSRQNPSDALGWDVGNANNKLLNSLVSSPMVESWDTLQPFQFSSKLCFVLFVNALWSAHGKPASRAIARCGDPHSKTKRKATEKKAWKTGNCHVLSAYRTPFLLSSLYLGSRIRPIEDNSLQSTISPILI